ncbi:MAG: CHAD domain-containing protein [Pseudolabrys sp.]
MHEKVHQLRKRCKKLRGLIRLVRPVFADYATENAALRDIARTLSFVRDTDVLIGTYDAVVEAYDDQIEHATFAPIRRKLTLRRKALGERRRDIDRRLAQFGDTMNETRRRARHWRIADNGFAALSAGLAKTYKRAGKAMAACQAEPTPAAFHEWRKRIKYHAYHARLLAPVWPGPMKAHRQAVERLGDLLGEHHDLAAFQQTLAAAPNDFGHAADVEVMIGLARRRQAALAAEAFPLGARLLAEPASALRDRWQAYWTV